MQPQTPLTASRIPRPLGRRLALGVLGAAVLLLTATGCGGSGELDTDYGARRGLGRAQSVNGTSVLAEMFEAEGAKVNSWTRLSPKLEQADVIVWAPDSFAPPTADARRWLEAWLRKKPGRTLVYIGRDYDGATEYWRKVQPTVPAAEAAEAARLLAQAQADYRKVRANAPKEAEYARWFVIDPKFAPRNVQTLAGPWADMIDPTRVEIPLATRLRIPQQEDVPQDETLSLPDAEELLISENDVLAYRLTQGFWNDGQIIVVTNGSFLLNLPLVNHEHRKLAGLLVAECGYPQRVVFLETGEGGPEIRAQEAGASGGFTMLTVWPLNVILLHAAVLGMLYLAARFPIFGRPHELPIESTGDFGKHIDALAQHLARTRDAAFAQARLIFYQQTARRESGTSHVKPQSAVSQHSAPAKPT